MARKVFTFLSIWSLAAVLLAGIGMGLPTMVYSKDESRDDLVSFGTGGWKAKGTASGRIPWKVKMPDGEEREIDDRGAGNLYLAGFAGLVCGFVAATLTAVCPRAGWTNAWSMMTHLLAATYFLLTAWWIVGELNVDLEFTPEAGQQWGFSGIALWACGGSALIIAVICVIRTFALWAGMNMSAAFLAKMGVGFITFAWMVSAVLVVVAFSSPSVDDQSNEAEDADKAKLLTTRVVVQDRWLVPLGALLASVVAFVLAVVDSASECSGFLPSIAALLSLLSAVLHLLWLWHIMSMIGGWHVLGIIGYPCGWSVVAIGLSGLSCIFAAVCLFMGAFRCQDYGGGGERELNESELELMRATMEYSD